MIHIKTQEQIDVIREGGMILGDIMDKVIKKVKPGVSTAELDSYAEELMIKSGGKPAFKGYKPSFSHDSFPCTLCTSINDEIVHAPAMPGRKLNDGDIVGIDVGFEYKGLFTDMARTVPVGDINDEARNLLVVTQECLDLAIKAIIPGEAFYEIGDRVQGLAEAKGYSVVRDLVGHGVGIEIHEDPQIPNYRVSALKRLKFQEGMVLAIEPMINVGEHIIELADDDWTYVTQDGSLSAQFEYTVAINYDGSVEVLTPTKWKMD